jgi:hypothetical protein
MRQTERSNCDHKTSLLDSVNGLGRSRVENVEAWLKHHGFRKERHATGHNNNFPDESCNENGPVQMWNTCNIIRVQWKIQSLLRADTHLPCRCAADAEMHQDPTRQLQLDVTR